MHAQTILLPSPPLPSPPLLSSPLPSLLTTPHPQRLEEIEETYSSITKAVELCKERLVEDCQEHTSSCLCGLQEKQDRLKLLLPVLQTTLKAADLFTSVSDRWVCYLSWLVQLRLFSGNGKKNFTEHNKNNV